MNTIQFEGSFNLDPKTILKDPLLTILGVKYNFSNMKVTFDCSFESNSYSHNRELEPIEIQNMDGLTLDQVREQVSLYMLSKKQDDDPDN
jgi:hypothetical protein